MEALGGSLLIVTLVIMVVGLVGSVLPGLPGVPLIFLSALAYALLTDFKTVGALILILLGLFAALALVVDFFATSYGARRFGASNWGTIGGAIGGILGALTGALFLGIGSLFGLILGTIGGVFLGEYLRRRKRGPERDRTPANGASPGDWRRASRAAGGVLIGYLVSSISQGVLGLASIIVFVLALIY